MKKLKSALIIAMLAALLSSTGVAYSASTPVPQLGCKKGEVIDGVSFNWCIARDAATTDPSKVLYYLHRANSDEKGFLDSVPYQTMKAYWAANSIKAPVIITVSFGPKWTLSDMPSTLVSGNPKPIMFDFFVNKIMPFMESHVTGTYGEPSSQPFTGRRFLMGESMGGYNAALLVEKRGDLFSKAIFGCPAFFTINRFSSASDITAYETRNNADDAKVRTVLNFLTADEPTLTDWNRNDPLVRVTRLSSSSPITFMWYDAADEYGFAEGARKFIANVPAGFNLQIKENAGGHCSEDADTKTAMAAFLQ